jgi:hypothetical protein
LPLTLIVIGASLFFGSLVGLKVPLAVSSRLPAMALIGSLFPFASAMLASARTSAVPAARTNVGRLLRE